MEKAIRDYLNIPTKSLTKRDIDQIKYLKISEPYNNRFSLEISADVPPVPFVDSNGGDEWEYCCVGKDNILKSIEYSSMEIVDEFGKYLYTKEQYEKYYKFLDSTKQYNEYGQAKDSLDSSKIIPNIEDWYENPNNCLKEDLCLFENLIILRINGICLTELKFLSRFKNLKVLECADSGAPDKETLKHLLKLQQLCIW